MNEPLPRRLRFFSRRRLSIQYQTEAAECGLACLAMLATYHGKRTDLARLRRQWPVSMKGLTFDQLIDMANGAGLRARPLRLELEELGKLATPCILHWRLDHFVVLEKVGRGGVTIVDPAVGRLTLRAAQVSRQFSGVALELSPASGFTTSEQASALRLSRFFRDAKGVLPSLLQLLALSLALQVFVLLTPFYSQLVIDDVVVSGDVDLLRLAAVCFIGLALFTAVTNALRGWLIVYIGSMLDFGWSSALFAHLVRLPYGYFEKRHVGDIQSRFGSLNAIRELLTTQAVEAVIDGLMAVTTVAVMLLYSPALSAIVVVSVLLYAAVRGAFYRALKAATHEMIIRRAVLDSYFLETLRGMVAIRNFGNEAGRKLGFENRAADSISSSAQAGRIGIWQESANRAIFGVQNVVVIWVAAVMIINAEFTVGMLVAFLAYKLHFATRTAALVDKFFQFRLARIHLDRLEDIVETPPEHPESVRVSRRGVSRRIDGRLELRNISFRYGRNEPLVLESLNLAVDAGEQVALAGPSGSGKSTVLKIMTGLVQPSGGNVLIDGRALRDFGLRLYRRRIGIVMQNDRLLSGTIIDNVAFFARKPDPAKVEAACRKAGILDEIARMPMGLYTLLGDMGEVLSGGQKQRLLLARALYHDPAILFLDEATSHLDADSEVRVVREIAALDITRVVAAHRAETLRHADRIVDLGSPRRVPTDMLRPRR